MVWIIVRLGEVHGRRFGSLEGREAMVREAEDAPAQWHALMFRAPAKSSMFMMVMTSGGALLQ